ncbi:ABC transporter ATP-binding protein [Chondrinema litorale]|uniref:ABC transporter ATP-binding protein n=1 Tax=Chondrinema litorale TaxID=2994555 RepID=UPI00254323A2|nr:ABC transporter ATP-binding protein [Chondrinema litorale]UZR93713.1 ABC transporter ATP-binding protein [Chondrinema litorale]
MDNSAIIIDNICISYEENQALKNISLDVKKGELFGLIGPDGAGKTSLIRILVTLLLADSGNAKVAGYDVVKDFKKLRNILGYMPGRFSLYQDLSVEENLNLFATIFGTTIQENYRLIKDIYEQIEPFKHRRAGKLSGGMKQKLALSCALIHKPEVLFLDEPTTGVDPVSRKEFWAMLKKLKDEGITIFVSTPYMDEAALCDRVALIQEGNILSIDSPENITKTFPKKLFAIGNENKYKLLKTMETYEYTRSVQPFGEYLHYTDVRADISTAVLQSFLENEIDGKSEVFGIKPNIEDCFMELMNQQEYE